MRGPAGARWPGVAREPGRATPTPPLLLVRALINNDLLRLVVQGELTTARAGPETSFVSLFRVLAPSQKGALSVEVWLKRL